MLSAQLMLFLTVVILVFILRKRKKHPTSVLKSSPEACSPMSSKTVNSVNPFTSAPLAMELGDHALPCGMYEGRGLSANG